MGDTTTEHAIERIFDKLDDMAEKQATVAKNLEVHIASEAEWQSHISDTIKAHTQEHSAAATVWRKGVVGTIFMLIGTLVVWAASFIWQHTQRGS
jgi:flagellar biosynthesis protein FlhB